MSILINQDTKVIVQGITGRDGSFHARQMIEYGTRIVAGVTPGKGGQKFDDTVPIFNTVAEAVTATGANTSVIYVPPMYAWMRSISCAGTPSVIAITVWTPASTAS